MAAFICVHKSLVIPSNTILIFPPGSPNKYKAVARNCVGFLFQ